MLQLNKIPNQDLLEFGMNNIHLSDDDLNMVSDLGEREDIPDAKKGYKLDGINDYVDYGDICNINGTSFSAGIWFRTNTLNTGNVRLFQKRGTGSTSTYAGWQISFSSTNGNFGNTVVTDGLGNAVTAVNFTQVVTDNVWHFIFITFDTATGTLKTYLDEELADTATNAALIGANLTTTRNLTTGCAWDDASTLSQFFNGYLWDARIYSRLLSEQEIKDLFNHKPISDNNLLFNDWCEAGLGFISFNRGSSAVHGIIKNATLSTFHYQGSDVPHSWQNEIGFNDIDEVLFETGDDTTNKFYISNNSNEGGALNGASLVGNKVITDGSDFVVYFMFKNVTNLPFDAEYEIIYTITRQVAGTVTARTQSNFYGFPSSTLISGTTYKAIVNPARVDGISININIGVGLFSTPNADVTIDKFTVRGKYPKHSSTNTDVLTNRSVVRRCNKLGRVRQLLKINQVGVGNFNDIHELRIPEISSPIPNGSISEFEFDLTTDDAGAVAILGSYTLATCFNIGFGSNGKFNSGTGNQLVNPPSYSVKDGYRNVLRMVYDRTGISTIYVYFNDELVYQSNEAGLFNTITAVNVIGRLTSSGVILKGKMSYFKWTLDGNLQRHYIIQPYSKELKGATVIDIVGGQNGTWTNHTEGNQYVKSNLFPDQLFKLPTYQHRYFDGYSYFTLTSTFTIDDINNFEVTVWINPLLTSSHFFLGNTQRIGFYRSGFVALNTTGSGFGFQSSGSLVIGQENKCKIVITAGALQYYINDVLVGNQNITGNLNINTLNIGLGVLSQNTVVSKIEFKNNTLGVTRIITQEDNFYYEDGVEAGTKHWVSGGKSFMDRYPTRVTEAYDTTGYVHEVNPLQLNEAHRTAFTLDPSHYKALPVISDVDLNEHVIDDTKALTVTRNGERKGLIIGKKQINTNQRLLTYTGN